MLQRSHVFMQLTATLTQGKTWKSIASCSWLASFTSLITFSLPCRCVVTSAMYSRKTLAQDFRKMLHKYWISGSQKNIRRFFELFSK